MRLFVVNVLNSQGVREGDISSRLILIVSMLQVQTLVHVVLYSQNDPVIYTTYGIEIIKDQNKRIVGDFDSKE